MPPTPTLPEIQALYTASRTAAARFASYNFHAYFLRRVDERFAPVLAGLGDTTTVTAVVQGGKLKAVEVDLPTFVADAKRELAVVTRAGATNAVYADSGGKLVVEVLEEHRHAA